MFHVISVILNFYRSQYTISSHLISFTQQSHSDANLTLIQWWQHSQCSWQENYIVIRNLCNEHWTHKHKMYIKSIRNTVYKLRTIMLVHAQVDRKNDGFNYSINNQWLTCQHFLQIDTKLSNHSQPKQVIDDANQLTAACNGVQNPQRRWLVGYSLAKRISRSLTSTNVRNKNGQLCISENFSQ